MADPMPGASNLSTSSPTPGNPTADRARLGIAVAADRPEFERDTSGSTAVGDVRQKLNPAERVWGFEIVRKSTIVLLLLLAWQWGALYYNNPLGLPTAWESHKALFDNLVPKFWEIKEWSWEAVKKACNQDNAPLLIMTYASIKLLLVGYAIGVLLACLLSVAATFTRIGRDFLETLTAMFSPLPAIALVPLALIWFGLGNPNAMIFVLIHSVMWPVALNMHSGFRASGTTLRMVGQNYGLGPFRFVAMILIPAAFPAILTGLKIGWAFGWRTLIAAELVFGVNGDQGGLGWFVFMNKNNQNTDAVFAGLLMVIFIGLLVENVIFRTVENKTVRRWGMQG